MWNSRTGALLHTFAGAHTQSICALVPHPFDPTSLASVGHDGAVCTWNVVARPSGISGVSSCGKRASFSNVLISGPQSEQYQHGMAVNVLDAVFSPDGASLAVADTVSRPPPPASLYMGRFFRKRLCKPCVCT